MASDSDTDTWHYNATCHATCHTQGLYTWHFNFFFKNL